MNTDTRGSALVATSLQSQDKNFFASPPGPASFFARLAVARANAKPGEGLRFWVARKNDPAMTVSPRLLLFALPGWEIEGGGTFWDNSRPHVIRADHDAVAVERRALLFVVRPGHEWADFIGLVRQMQRDGENYDAPVLHIWEWMPENLGKGQLVAFLDAVDEAGEGSAQNG